MYEGSCLCGSVRFKISGEISNIVNCHCSQCRKAQGTAFATNGVVDKMDFVITKGESELKAYPLSTVQTRYFCRHCGSPIMSSNITVPGKVRIRLGTIESDITERPGAHIFVSSKANWNEIADGLPQYDSYESERS